MSKFGVLLLLMCFGDSQVLPSAIPIDDQSQRQFLNVGDEVAACKGEFTQLGDHCYYFSRTKATWQEASKACHSLNAALAHPKNSEENSQLAQYNKETKGGWWARWIGATDRDNEGQWVWAHDNTPVNYTEWQSGEPNNAYENENCAHYSSHEWMDSPCEDKYYYICQYVDVNDYSRIVANGDGKLEETIPSTTTTTTTTAAPPTVSKSDFIQLGEHSYRFSRTKATFDQASKACQSIGTQLAHPKNSLENSKLTQYLLENKRRAVWWIGATDRDHEGQWVWSHDNTSVGDHNWLWQEPSNNNENEHCAQLMREPNYHVNYNVSYKWNDAPCNNKYNFICQSGNLYDDSQELSSSAEKLEETKQCVPNTAVDTEDDPPFNITKVGDNNYYFSHTEASFDNAHKTCNCLGAELAHLNSEEENSELTEYLNNHYGYGADIESWWIGGTDRDKEGEWVWAHDKSPVGYADWYSEVIPNDPYPTETCAVLHRRITEYKWYDPPCGIINHYICQYPNLKDNSHELPGSEMNTSGEVQAKINEDPSNTDQVLASATTNIGLASKPNDCCSVIVTTCIVIAGNLLPTATLIFSHL